MSKILCISADTFASAKLESGFTAFDNQAESCLGEWLMKATFEDREQAETNEGLRQLIPYCVILRDEKFLTYFRSKKQGDERLRGQMSIGIGGHIDEEDREECAHGEVFTYLNGLSRELKEELGIDVTREQLAGTAVGVVFNDDTEVGRVHVGIVHLIAISPEVELQWGDDMQEPEFMPGQWLRPFAIPENGNTKIAFERWSEDITKFLLANPNSFRLTSRNSSMTQDQMKRITQLGNRTVEVNQILQVCAETGYDTRLDPKNPDNNRRRLVKTLAQFLFQVDHMVESGDVSRDEINAEIQSTIDFYESIARVKSKVESESEPTPE